ncbi:hypothetical protein EHO60_01430 [Leptospira fletcheri]|uniref:XRE family transcriptional regulator n=1 Tax=Leptospira fletcheri TaxID=2484981 RepID=A0A4R9GJW7_9LEPT|nr:hypothetical protein [Leptospira fletcheri]TGK14032.1 hypothetical protein EHO60_01430 [Leptospira fletcheri]
MKTPAERFQYILNNFDGTQEEFGRTIRKSRQLIGAYAAGKRTIPEATALVIELVHGYSKEWLLSGVGIEKADVLNNPIKALHQKDSDRRLIQKINAKEGIIEVVEDLMQLSSNDLETIHRAIKSLIKPTNQ